MPVLLSLLWALLKAGMVSDVFSVLNVSLAYKIVVSGFHPPFNTTCHTAVAPLLSSRGQACSVLHGKRSTRWAHFSCLTSLAMSSCWPSSTLWEKRVSRVLYLSSCSLHTRYVGSGTLWVRRMYLQFSCVCVWNVWLRVNMLTDGWCRSESGLPGVCKTHSWGPAVRLSELCDWQVSGTYWTRSVSTLVKVVTFLNFSNLFIKMLQCVFIFAMYKMLFILSMLKYKWPFCYVFIMKVVPQYTLSRVPEFGSCCCGNRG